MNKQLAIHARHDANVTIVNGDVVEQYLELEKIANKRYFAFDKNSALFKKQFNDYVMPYINPKEITKIVYIWLTEDQLNVLKELFPHVKEWTSIHHHISHVMSAYMFTKPREDDLIISIDGGGDLEDYFYIYSYRRGNLVKLLEVKVNLGKPYRILGLLSPELYKDRDKGYLMTKELSGKKMSLLAYGKVREKYRKPLEEFYFDFMLNYDQEKDTVEKNFKIFMPQIGHAHEKFLDRDTARDILATSQDVFEKTIERHLYPYLDEKRYKRVIVTGGCALNVTMNSKIEKDYNIKVFTAPCPNDCGISLGASKIVNPNLKMLQRPFTNISPTNKNILKEVKKKFPNKDVTIPELAALLHKGLIIATMIGPLEIGPRALGNRSYLASPLSKGMKNRLNSPQIKDREYWRPVAPIVTLENLKKYFETKNPSPYMTFAPKIKKRYKSLLSEVAHVDGSARAQTAAEGSGWIYHLIKEFGKISGTEILMNTSFNEKGHPLINDYKEAFTIFEQSDLDGIVISEKEPTKKGKMTLFLKQRAKK